MVARDRRDLIFTLEMTENECNWRLTMLIKLAVMLLNCDCAGKKCRISSIVLLLYIPAVLKQESTMTALVLYKIVTFVFQNIGEPQSLDTYSAYRENEIPN